METENKETIEETTEKAEETVTDVPEKDNKKEKKAPDSKKLKSKIKSLEEELEKEKAKNKDAEDKYLRLAAEYDNFRRRSQKEREGIYADAAADSIKELLPLLDNLERATQFTSADKVAEGVEMILKTLPDVFEKMKIVTFGEVGEQFDPNMHNAVMHVDDESLGENEITDVFQKGYMIGDKIIRYAMVKVAN